MATDVPATSSQAYGITYADSAQNTADRVKQKALGQDEFFKLLTTQLASQDPLKPMEDTAFIAQMASFSELEMTSNLTKSFDRFSNIQQFNAAQSFLGKKVTFMDQVTSGTVTAIERQGDETLLFLDGANTGYSSSLVHKVEN